MYGYTVQVKHFVGGARKPDMARLVGPATRFPELSRRSLKEMNSMLDGVIATRRR
jgi:hypothetical protein